MYNHTGVCKTITTRRGSVPRRYVIKRTNIMSLPVECIYIIFSKLPHLQRLKFGLTCRLMRSVSMMFHETIFNPVRAFAECEDPTLGELFKYVPERLIIGFSDIDPITIVKSKTKEIIAVHMRDVSMVSAYFAAAKLGDINAAEIVHTVGLNHDSKEAEELCFSSSYVAADVGHYDLANWFRRKCTRRYNKIMVQQTSYCNIFTKGLVNKYSVKLNKWLLSRGEIVMDEYRLSDIISYANTVDDMEWCAHMAMRIGYNIPSPGLFIINELVRRGNFLLLMWWSDRYDITDYIRQCQRYCTTLPMHTWINQYLNVAENTNDERLPLGDGQTKCAWNPYDSGLLKLLFSKGRVGSIKFFNIIYEMDNRSSEENKRLTNVMLRLPYKYSYRNGNIIEYDEDAISDCGCGINVNADYIIKYLLMGAAVLSDLGLLDYIRITWENALRDMCDSSYHITRPPFYLIIEDMCDLLYNNYHTISRESLNWICYWYEQLVPADHKAARYPFKLMAESTVLRTIRVGYKARRGECYRTTTSTRNSVSQREN